MGTTMGTRVGTQGTTPSRMLSVCRAARSERDASICAWVEVRPALGVHQSRPPGDRHVGTGLPLTRAEAPASAHVRGTTTWSGVGRRWSLVAVHARFAEADLASILDHHHATTNAAAPPSRAGEDGSLTQGTAGWAALGTPVTSAVVGVDDDQQESSR